MQVTVKELIQDALTMLMVYSPDTILTAEESNSALRALNGLIESLANESATINLVSKESFTLVGGQATYTWGIGGNFDSPRPVTVAECTASITTQSAPVDVPVSIINYDDYAAIKMKTLQTNYPQCVYMDGAYPLLNVTFYPIPSSAVPVTFYSFKPISEFTNVADFIELPQGYYRFLTASLAIELAPSYQLTASQNIFNIRTEAKRNLLMTNKRSLTLQTDPALMGTGGHYNIWTDQFGRR